MQTTAEPSKKQLNLCLNQKQFLDRIAKEILDVVTVTIAKALVAN